MTESRTRVGLDVGGVYVKIVVLDQNDRIMQRLSTRHHGNPVAIAREQLLKLDVDGSVAVGITGSYAPLVAGGLNLVPVDFVNAEIKAVRRVFPEARNVINVGGSSVTLVQIDERGNFLDYNTNSLCAAGTGSFLDQQADRLNINYDYLGKMRHNSSPPPIATRCSVFAKSDLIHRQQEGYDKAALWCGLCRSMTRTFLNTLLRGRPLSGQTILTGGVSQNTEVLHWLKAEYGDLIQTFDDAAFCGAIGAAHMTNGHVDDIPTTARSLRDISRSADEAPRRPMLECKRTRYPSFDVAESYVDDSGNEVRVTSWPGSGTAEVYIGIDIGSTSSKLLLMDSDEKVLADVYRRTAGDPIQATRHLFSAVSELAKSKGTSIDVLGVATTGSGRKLVGKVIGADLISNEITAHLTGAMHVDDRVDTIFEIGGQDAKYIHARNGRIVNSNMNYVCAAGTGSFVEEQARKLGFDLEAIGDMAMGIAPPVTSDRCTVFMEQDVDRLIRQGYTREECMAAVLCSVVKNYLNKVVGRRHVSRERIFFQGATARNKGLVAAFEILLDAEMVVSPYCHVMGAYGAALLVKRGMDATVEPTQFKGLDLASRKISLRTEPCNLCANHCNITFADIEGDPVQPSWGYMCGRDPDDEKLRVRPEYEPVRKRLAMLFKQGSKPKATAVKTIGISRTLVTYSLYPLWQRFFHELGCNVAISAQTSEDTVRRGNELSAADFCLPMKIAHGHAAELARDQDVDLVFLPYMISADPNPSTSNSLYCPYVQSAPSVIRSALTQHGVDASRILRPVVDLSLTCRSVLDDLFRCLARPLGVSRAQIRNAWRTARQAQHDFETLRQEEGRRLLDDLAASGKPAIVLMGRPYNTLDDGVNLSLPRKIADQGFTVIPMDMLPYDVTKINPAFSNMYWSYGQEILSAAEYIRHSDNLYGIYFSNFSCGPDSFLLSLTEEVMGEKPFLELELDEHGGDAGYMTRIEAFFDVIRAWTPRPQKPFTVLEPKVSRAAIKDRTLWLPNMHPIGSELYAAAFRGEGFKAQPLPVETRDTFELGRSLTRGSECMPTACTTGSFINIMRKGSLAPGTQALFMPGSTGPCRFGQYGLLQRLVLNRSGMGEVALLSPSCGNAYQGLNQNTRRRFWQALLCADLLWKAACKIRPYENERGATDRVLHEEVERIANTFERRENVRGPFRDAIAHLGEVPAEGLGSRPLVGIVGEIYVRCNAFANDHLIHEIERLGGEAWLSPISEWILYTAAFHKWDVHKRHALNVGAWLGAYVRNAFLARDEHEFRALSLPFLADRSEPPIEDIIRKGEPFLPINFSGEAIITLGRAVSFVEQKASLIVNVAPFGCMPGTITSALCREIQSRMGVPVVNLFYDGESGGSGRLATFLAALTSNTASRTAVKATQS